MARSKRDKERAQRFLSIVDPANIDLSDYTAQTQDGKQMTNDDLARARNSGNNPTDTTSGGSKQTFSSADLAGSSNTSPFESSSQSPPGTQTNRIPFTPRAASYNPMLFGNTNVRDLAGSMLEDFNTTNNAPNVMDLKPMAPGNTIRGRSAEEKLLEAIANTNPSPQGTWKRLLSGVGRGLQQAAPDLAQGNYGGAFGKIAANTVLNAIPAIDQATQYEQNVGRAKEQYKVDKLAQDADISRRKSEADIAETNERLRLSSEQRTQQLRRDAMLDAARLRDDKRAEADQQLRILEKLPADDPERNSVVRELATKYQMRVSPRYGLQNEKQITIYDEQSGNYIRASEDGTPITDKQGNTIVVRPGRVDSPREAKDRAMQKVISKYGGDAKSVARLSTENRKEEIINSLHPDFAKALRNPSSSNAMVVTDAQKAYDEAFNRLLKQNEAFTEALYEREVSESLNSPTNKTSTPRQSSTSKQGAGKVSSSVPQGYFKQWK